ncbi:hypothetical protein CsatA_018492 [Cannabis sativa]
MEEEKFQKEPKMGLRIEVTLRSDPESYSSKVKPTYFGGFTRVLGELRIYLSLDLLFSGFKEDFFVEDTKLFVKNDLEVADDLTTMLKKLFNKDETLQKSPLFIVAESYGGKFAVISSKSH